LKANKTTKIGYQPQEKSMENLNEINIAFDNAGGITIVAPTYAHSYSNGRQVADDVTNLIEGSKLSLWDGNDEELLAALTPDELDRYERVYTVAEIEELCDRRDTKVEIDEDGVSIHDGRLNARVSGFSETQFFLAMMGR